MKRVSLFLLFSSTCLAQGIITTAAGTDYIFPDEGKFATQAQIAGPNAMAFDQRGNLYFAEPDLNMVMRIDGKGIVSVVAGNGLQRFAGDGGPARSASLAHPWGVGTDSAGNIYIADTRNQRVRQIDANGIITTVAGGGSQYPGDGLTAGKAALLGPVGVVFDPSGNMLILDSGRLRKVNSAGIISTVAGNDSGASTGNGGPALSASLAGPDGIAVAGGRNHLYRRT